MQHGNPAPRGSDPGAHPASWGDAAHDAAHDAVLVGAVDRHAACTVAIAVRRAEVHGDPVDVRPSGVAVGCARYPASREDNCLLVTGSASATQVGADAWPLVAGAEPAVVLLGPGAGTTADQLRSSGWTIGVNRVLAICPASWSGAVGVRSTVQVSVADTAGLTRAIWGEEIDAPHVVDQLVEREARTVTAVPTVVRAVLEDGVVVASGQLRIDGSTACIESLQTLPGARRGRAGDAVLASLVAAAQRSDCDLVLLEADATDWPQHWYRRRGFRDVGSVHHAHRSVTVAPS